MRWALWMLFFAFVGQAQEPVEPAAFMKLSDVQGRVIEVRVLAVDQEEFSAELRNGNTFTLPLSRLSPASLEQVRTWEQFQKNESTGKTGKARQRRKPFKFPMEFEERELPHYRIFTDGDSIRPADVVAERVYNLFTPRMPGLWGRFERGRVPIDLYVIHSPEQFEAMTKVYAGWLREDDLKEWILERAPITGDFRDFNSRFYVMLRNSERDMSGQIAHALGFEFGSLAGGGKKAPFWLQVGCGLYAEHSLYDRCTVLYLAGEPKRYTRTQNWAPLIQEDLAQGKLPPLQELLGLEPGVLEEREMAASLAFSAFLMSSRDQVKKFEVLLTRLMREELDAEQVAGVLGYPSFGAMDQAWKDWIAAGGLD